MFLRLYSIHIDVYFPDKYRMSDLADLKFMLGEFMWQYRDYFKAYLFKLTYAKRL